MKVVISDWGWGLSKKAYKRIAELMGVECHFYKYDYITKESQKLSFDEIESMDFVDASTISDVEFFTKLMGKYYVLPVKEANDLIKLFILPDFRGLNDNKERSNPILIRVAEELGDELMDKSFHKPKVVEIPDDVEWYIDSDEGCEWVAEKHRRWQ